MRRTLLAGASPGSRSADLPRAHRRLDTRSDLWGRGNWEGATKMGVHRGNRRKCLRRRKGPSGPCSSGQSSGTLLPCGFWAKHVNLKEGTEVWTFSRISHDLGEPNNKTFCCGLLSFPTDGLAGSVHSSVPHRSTHCSTHLGQKHDSDAISAPEALLVTGANRWVTIPVAED